MPPHLTDTNRPGRRIPAAGRFLAGVLAGLLAGAAAHANPTDPTVVHGSAHFARPGANALDVTTSPNAIIHARQGCRRTPPAGDRPPNRWRWFHYIL